MTINQPASPAGVIMSPTVGRIVLFHPASQESRPDFAPPNAGEPLAAVVAHVWNDRMVNLAVFDANGVSHSRTSVTMIHEGDTPPEYGHYCEWMPYQKRAALGTLGT